MINEANVSPSDAVAFFVFQNRRKALPVIFLIEIQNTRVTIHESV